VNTFRSLLAVILLSVQIYIATAMAQQSCPLNVNTRLLQNGYSVLTCKPGVPGSLINDTLAIKDVTSYGTRFGNGEIWPQDQNPNTPLISSWTPADFNISGTGDQEVFSVAINPDNGDIYTASTRLWGTPAAPGSTTAPLSPGITAVYRIDGTTGVVNLIVNITFDVNPLENFGASYVTYDERTDQLFVVGLDTGSIYRIDPTLSGVPAVLQIYNPDIDGLIPEDTVAGVMAPRGERILGLAWNPGDNRLYYSVWAVDGAEEGTANTVQNTIRSVALDLTNAINGATDQLEITMPDLNVTQEDQLNQPSTVSFSDNYSMPVGDIAFNRTGTRVILSETGFDDSVPETQAHRTRLTEWSLAGGVWSIVGDQSRYGIGESISFMSGPTLVEYHGINARGGAAWAYDAITPPRVTGIDDFFLSTGDALSLRAGQIYYGYQFMPTAGPGDLYDSLVADLDGDNAGFGKGLFGDVDILMCAFEAGNFVWYDSNQNGIQDGGEPGVQGVQVELHIGAGCGSPTGITDTTDVAGLYGLVDLVPGTYSLQFSNLPAGAVVSAINQGGNDALDSDVDPGTLCLNSFDLTSNDDSLDMGISVPGSVGDKVWCDGAVGAGDMVFTAGEGLNNITVDLFNDLGCDGTADGAAIATTVTLGDGDYSFTGLNTGPSGSPICYISQVDVNDPDLMACDSLGSPSATNQAQLTQDNPDDLTHDYYFEQNLLLGDFVWYDTNQNGLQEIGEPGVNGITVELFDNATCTAPAINSTLTANGGVPASDGYYQFSGLAVGSYCVQFSGLPAGHAFTVQDFGGDDAIDSDANPGDGQVQNIALNNDNQTIDAGIFRNGSIAGLAWCESSTNVNATYNAGDGDALLSDITVTLYEDLDCSNTVNGAEPGTAVATSTNNPTGDYLFSGLPVGPVGNPVCYVVEVDTADPQLGSCDTPITSTTQGPDLDVNAPDVTGVNFGFDDLLSLGDFVWYDTNQNGLQDAGEPGVNGITVELFDNATCTAPAINSTLTANGGVPANDGYYQFLNLDAGTYCVQFSNLPAAHVFTLQNFGVDDAIDSDANPGNGQVQNIALNNDNQTIDAGIFRNGSIAGLAWCESSTNANATYNAGDGDALLSDITVTLYEDLDCSNTVNGAEPGTAVVSSTNNPTGDYLFSGLPVGPAGNALCYVVEVDTTDLQLGVCDTPITSTTQGPDLDVNTPDVTGVNFGFDDQLSLGDFVWYDTNQNGLQDAGEPGVNGITVELFDNATCTAPAINSTVTANGGVPANDGYYQFLNLDAGTYCVQFSGLPAGHVFTLQDFGVDDAIDSDANPGNGQVQSIVLNNPNQTIDAGIFSNGSIAGLAWCESATNANTTYNAGDGDTLLSDITVTLYEDQDCSDTVNGAEPGTAVAISTNNPTGDYLFSGLPVGPAGSPLCYVVEVDSADPDLGICDTPITSTTQGPDLDVNTPDVTDVNFGFDDQLSLGNFVWYDTNQNGLQDVGEPGVNGITVELFDNATCTAPAINSTVTANGGVPANDGYYQFMNLDVGVYCVQFSGLPAGHVFTVANAGANDTIDSDANATTGQVQNINLTDVDQTIDAGIYQNGSIAGLTWCESSVNVNTSYDAGDGDTLLSDITVTLFEDQDCSDTVNGIEPGTAVVSSTNNPTGDYLFSGLPVGPAGSAVCYVVEVDDLDPDLGACANPITSTTQGPDLDVNTPDVTDVNFGFDDQLSLGDYVWYDNNQNGVQDAGEPGVNGITVELFDNATCTAPAINTTVTANGGVPAADGYYLFTDLDAGSYCVSFSGLPVNYEFTVSNQGGNDATDSDANEVTGEVTNIVLNAVDRTIDVGVYASNGEVSGLLYCDDSPENGTQDAGEEVSGVTVTLERDLGCDSVADAVIGSTVTDGTGQFAFTNLPVALSPAPPNPQACYLLSYDTSDAVLGNCNDPVTPDTQTVTIDTDDPVGTPVVFVVVAGQPPMPVPVNNWFTLLMMLAGLGLVGLYQFRSRQS